MKRLRTIIALFTVCTGSLHAQSLSAGVHAGFTTGSVKVSDIPSAFATTVEGSSMQGVEAGLFAKLDLNPFYIKPMALLNYRRGTVTVNSENQAPGFDHFSLTKAEVPLLFGLHLIGPLNIEAGPVYNYIIASSDDVAGNTIDVQKSGIGYRVGATGELGRIILGISYQGIKNESSSDNISSIKTPDELIFSLGFRLGKAGK